MLYQLWLNILSYYHAFDFKARLNKILRRQVSLPSWSWLHPNTKLNFYRNQDVWKEIIFGNYSTPSELRKLGVSCWTCIKVPNSMWSNSASCKWNSSLLYFPKFNGICFVQCFHWYFCLVFLCTIHPLLPPFCLSSTLYFHSHYLSSYIV